MSLKEEEGSRAKAQGDRTWEELNPLAGSADGGSALWAEDHGPFPEAGKGNKVNPPTFLESPERKSSPDSLILTSETLFAL